MKRWGLISAGAALLLLALILAVALTGGDGGKFVVGKPLPPGPATPQICITYNSQAVMLAPDGSLWAWGGSGTYSGPLVGRTGLMEFPQRLSADRDWRAVMLASFGVVALKADGTLWQWNSSGPRPPASTNSFVPPKQIGTDTNWLALSGMVSHFMALKRDGSLWGWGQNESGQVGLYKPGDENKMEALTGQLPINGQPSRVMEPTMVGVDHDWKVIAAGAFNSYALKQDGTLWGWGSGLGPAQGKTNDHSPKQIDPGSNWVAMAVGDYHLLALKSDGTLWLRGQNSYSTARDYSKPDGNLFPIGQDTDWTDIYSGQNCFFARKKDGSWWACGDNTSGKLGLGNPIRMPAPPRMSPASAVAASRGRRGGAGVAVAGNPMAWRQVSSLEKMPLNLDPWAFASGGETTLLLTKDGTLWTWGTRLGSKRSPFADKGVRGLYNMSVEWLRGIFRPKAQTQSPAAVPFVFGSPNQTEIVDPAPHKLWTLPPEVRSGLGTNATSNSAR